MTEARERIKALMDEYRELEQSEENKRRRSMWKELAKSGRDQFRPTPLADRSWKHGKIPVTADIQNPTWAKIIGFDLRKFYFDAPTFVENYLRIMIFRFRNFNDDTFLNKWLPMWGTSVIEGAMFGLPYSLFEDNDPWLDNRSIINNEDDIKRVRDHMPAFKTSGIMPELINCYENCLELIDDDFEVLFPEWNRSIFGVATYIHQYEDLLVNMKLEPEYCYELFRMISDVRKEWYRGYAAYFGTTIPRGNLYNDEINCPTLSPELYRDLLLPFEQEQSRFHNGIYYWHSCGDVTPMLDEISKLQNLELMNCGPWTDVFSAGVSFRDKCPIEICMDPQRDILEGTPETMWKKISDTIAACLRSDICGFNFKLSAINMYRTLPYTIGQIQLFLEQANKVISSINTAASLGN